VDEYGPGCLGMDGEMKRDLLSYGTDEHATDGTPKNIVCVSGGLASGYVAYWASKNLENVTYYFNDTKWEHPDLYRFMSDLENRFNIEIMHDNDGRSPEDVFYDEKILGSNRLPVCSRILKAKRLQRFANKGDTIYFGIGPEEIHRAARITPIYARLGVSTQFPLIDNEVTKNDVLELYAQENIDIPQLYKDGFTHNNCSGGCIRGGMKHWSAVLRVYPDVYADRERIEHEFFNRYGKKATFLKEMSLTDLREAIQKQGTLDFGEDEWQGECVGICGTTY